MKKKITTLLCTLMCMSALSITANASTSSSYDVGFANGNQRASLTVYGNSAAVGSYQNFNGGHVYVSCTSNLGITKSDREAKSAGFMINGKSFSTYHELVGGGWTNHYSR